MLWPLGVYFLAVVGLVFTMLLGSWMLGQRKRHREDQQPYESGITSTGAARVRFSPDFYLYAVFFVIFDLESVFIYSWVIAAREVGWPAYLQMCIFVGVLLASLFYLWRQGALELKR